MLKYILQHNCESILTSWVYSPNLTTSRQGGNQQARISSKANRLQAILDRNLPV